MSNKQKPTKKTSQREYAKPELYEGYYWLILHVDPYNFSYGFLNEMGIPKEAIHPVPECIKDAREMFKEVVEPSNKYYVYDEETKTTVEKDLSPDDPLYTPSYPYVNVDKIFNWLLEQEIPTRSVGGRNIEQKEDVRILWEHLRIPDPVYDDNYKFDNIHFHKIEHYLEPQHKKNLETLASQVGLRRTLSVADIITDPRVNISKSWFTELKKRIPLPPSDTVKDHGEAWIDGEKVIKMIIEWRTANPKRPPQKLATTTQKKHTFRRKK